MKRRLCECARWCEPNGQPLSGDRPGPCSCACHQDHRRAVLSVYRSIQALGHGIINTHDQNSVAGGDRIFLTYTPHDRQNVASGWHVVRMKNGVPLVTDKDAAWYDRKLKAFSCYGRADKERARLEAVAWITAKYGPRDLVRNAMGDFVEAEVQELYPIRRRR